MVTGVQTCALPIWDRVRAVIRADDGTRPTKHLTALIGGLVPATVVDAHARGVDPTVVVSGRLHAEVVIADTAADGNATRRQIGTLEATVTRLESQLANPGFIAGAPARVVDEARRRLAEATAQMEVLRRTPSGGRTDGG